MATAAAAFALLVGGCMSPAGEVPWAVGSCALVGEGGTTIAVECSEAHTHRVIAIAPDAESCPRDTAMYISPADPDEHTSTTCFQVDPARP
jgi:hypothetical protein